MVASFLSGGIVQTTGVEVASPNGTVASVSGRDRDQGSGRLELWEVVGQSSQEEGLPRETAVDICTGSPRELATVRLLLGRVNLGEDGCRVVRGWGAARGPRRMGKHLITLAGGQSSQLQPMSPEQSGLAVLLGLSYWWREASPALPGRTKTWASQAEVRPSMPNCTPSRAHHSIMETIMIQALKHHLQGPVKNHTAHIEVPIN